MHVHVHVHVYYATIYYIHVLHYKSTYMIVHVHACIHKLVLCIQVLSQHSLQIWTLIEEKNNVLH